MLPAFAASGRSGLFAWMVSLLGRAVVFAGFAAAALLACVGLADPRVQEAFESPAAAAGCSGLSVRRLQLAEDGRTVWVVRLPNRLQNVDLLTGRVLIDTAVPAPLSHPPQITATGPHMVFANHRGQLRMQRLDDEAAPARRLRTSGGPIDQFTVCATTNTLALVSREVLELWRLDDPDQPSAVAPLPQRISTLAWSPDGTRLLVLQSDGSLLLRDGRTLAELATVPTQISGGCHAAWSHDGRTAIAYGLDGPIAVWEVTDPTVPPTHIDFDYRCSVGLSPDGTQLAICDVDQQQWLVDVADPASRRCLARLPTLASAVCFTADERLLVGTLDGDLLCWSLAENALEWRLTGEDIERSDWP